MKSFLSTMGALLAIGLTVGLARADDSIESQRIVAYGYRLLLPSGEMGPIQQLGFGDVAVKMTPDVGYAYKTPLEVERSTNRFHAEVPFGYVIERWMVRYDLDRSDGVDVVGSSGMSDVVIPWDGLGDIINLILVVKEEPERKVTFGKSPFGEGMIGRAPGTVTCKKGDTFELNAVPAFDDGHQVALSRFLRWSDGEEAAQRTVVVDSNDTYVAVFEPSSWSVRFNPNGGEVKPSTKVVTYGFSYGALPTPRLPGSTFVSWSAEGKPVDSGTTVGPLGDHELVAVWTNEPTYVVSFEPNGAEGSPYVQVMTNGVGGVLAPNRFVRVGYTFACWSNETAGVVRTFADGARITADLASPNETNTLWAVWQPIPTYAVSFEPNGAEGSPYVQVMTNGVGGVLTSNRFARAGYTFACWSNATTRATFEDGQEFKTDLAKPGETNSLLAVWRPIVYTLHFDGNGGTCGSDLADRKMAYGQSVEIVFNLEKDKGVYREGYSLRFWSTNQNETVSGYVWNEANPLVLSNLTTEAGATVTLYAIWEPEAQIRYTIAFDGNGADNPDSMASTNVAWGEEIDLPSNRFVRAGYEFGGWTNSVGAAFGDGDKVSNLTNANETVTLFAKWEGPIEYTIAFDGNGADNPDSMASTNVAWGEEIELPPNQFVRADYRFEGWTNAVGTAFGDRDNVSNLTHVATTVWLYAKWVEKSEPIKYTIAFDGNEADNPGSMPSISNVARGAVIALPSNQFVRAGYEFAGWATNDVSGVVFGDGVTVSNLTEIANQTVTLFASWNDMRTPYSRALWNENFHLVVDVSAGGAWITNETEKAVYRESSCPDGTLMVTIPCAGNLNLGLNRDTGIDSPLTVSFETNGVPASFQADGKSVIFKSYTQENDNLTLSFDEAGKLIFSGTPDDDTWTLSNFKWFKREPSATE